MSIFEDDEKLHEKTLLEIGREEGMQQGIQQGIQGTVGALKSIGVEEEGILDKLMEIYKIDMETARTFL